MKKFLTILAVCMLFLTAMAGCDNGLTHSGENRDVVALTNVRSVTLDPVANCPVETAHYHDGVCYAGHYNNDGCSHNHGGETLTANTACTVSGTHQHNGQHYGGHHGDDGCNSGSDHHGNGHE